MSFWIDFLRRADDTTNDHAFQLTSLSRPTSGSAARLEGSIKQMHFHSWLAALCFGGTLLALGCGSSSGSGGSAGSAGTGTGGGAGAGTGGTSGAAGSGGGATNSVNAAVPSGTVAFTGEAVAFYVNSTKTDLQILINEGSASCTATPGFPSGAGKHDFEVDLVGIAGSTPPYSAMTYSDTNSTAANMHVEAYLSLPCESQSAQYVATNGGTAPYSVTITSIDATQVSGTFEVTMTEHVSGGKQFQATGSFSAPICDHGRPPTCN